MACWLVYNVRISYILINISLAPSFSAPFPKQYSIKPACCLAHSAPGGLIIRTWVGTLRGSSPRRAAPDAPGPGPGLGGSLPCAACQRGPGCVPLASLFPAQRGQGAPPVQDPPGVPLASPHRARRVQGQWQWGQQSLLERALPARAQHTHGHACSPRTAAGLGNAARAGQHRAKQHPTSVPAFICAPLGLAGRSRDLSPAPNKLSDYIRLICFEVPTAIRLHNPSLYPAEIHLYLRIFLFVLVARLLLPRRVSKCQSAQDNTYTHLLN